MEILSKLLGGGARVKIMRLFLLNKNNVFAPKEITKRARISLDSVRREIKLLRSVGFLKKRGGNWSFNSLFKYKEQFEELLVLSENLNVDSILGGLRKTGQIKLVVISGFFIKNKDTIVDLLVVGDKIKKGKIEEEIKKIEAELGTELVYAIFETKEFVYRFNMYDKLVRDILDYPHKVIFETKELSTQALKKT